MTIPCAWWARADSMIAVVDGISLPIYRRIDSRKEVSSREPPALIIDDTVPPVVGVDRDGPKDSGGGAHVPPPGRVPGAAGVL
jgi:hypothetical protein